MKEVDIKRDAKIDVLRGIAIVSIIFAHSGPNGIIFQLRNFDVTLMVVIMGISFYLSNRKKEIKYFNYLRKRFKRLIIPTWKFLTLFFVTFYGISLFFQHDYYFDKGQIVNSYTTLSGIGYVWIMWVFFFVAIVSPLLLYVSRKIEDNKKYFILLIGFYIFYVVLLKIHGYFPDNIQIYFDHFILQGVGYSIIAAFGIRLKLLNKSELLFYFILFIVIFSFLLFKNDFTQTQVFKYPPTLYYFSYGLMVTLLFYVLLDISFIKKLFVNKFNSFLSRKSIWLYFWHLIPLFILKLFGSNMQFINYNFVTRFIFLFLIALLLAFIQEFIEMKIPKRKSKSIS
ncbi:acyltransferase family protein [Ornithinibacillus contaminans]|uniref:acyltransferase family protein n=1 Tax=Ornithinibacillus contaminans TaxID=694055 RepID=UPI00064E0187|nr:acyltransferase [Ornithinibacillus contaminans]